MGATAVQPQEASSLSRAVDARVWTYVALIAAVTIQFLCLNYYSHNNSAIVDEGFHLGAGIKNWQCRDFGMNPEHPPLAKLIAAFPLRNWQITETGQCGAATTPKPEGFRIDYNIVNAPLGDAMVQHGRHMMMMFPVVLLVLVFFAVRDWFGNTAGWVALSLGTFEPTLQAHAALITTDMALTTTLFATVWLTWCFLQNRTWARATALGIVLGLTLAAKHSGITAVLIIVALVVAHNICSRASRRQYYTDAVYLAGIGALAITLLWATYGFRFNALPHATAPSFSISKIYEDHGRADAKSRIPIEWAHRHHLLPESYLYGLADVLLESSRITRFLGHSYKTGVWFYFPFSLALKTSLTVLLFFGAGLLSLRLWRSKRESVLFVVIPFAIFLGIAMTAKLNIGVRHVLPLYPFMIALGAGAAANARWKRWPGVAVAVLVALQACSSLWAAPHQLAYSNELFSSIHPTYLWSAESNADWGQGALELERFAASHPIEPCLVIWSGHRMPKMPQCIVFAGTYYSRDLPVLPPDHFRGNVFASVQMLERAGSPFRGLFPKRPDLLIGGHTALYRGDFDLTPAAVSQRLPRGYWYLDHGHLAEAATEFEAASPKQTTVQFELARTYELLGKDEDAIQHYRLVLDMADSDRYQDVQMRHQSLEAIDRIARRTH